MLLRPENPIIKIKWIFLTKTIYLTKHRVKISSQRNRNSKIRIFFSSKIAIWIIIYLIAVARITIWITAKTKISNNNRWLPGLIFSIRTRITINSNNNKATTIIISLQISRIREGKTSFSSRTTFLAIIIIKETNIISSITINRSINNKITNNNSSSSLWVHSLNASRWGKYNLIWVSIVKMIANCYWRVSIAWRIIRSRQAQCSVFKTIISWEHKCRTSQIYISK